jgi:signal recognition particle subunit SRP72
MAKSAPPTRDETFELSYNAACALISQGNYKEAEGKLRQALDLCRKALEEDDVPDDEIEAELGIIRVQLGYVLHKMGKIDPALKLYNQVLKLKPSDIGLAAVACNNVVCINKDQNLFDSKKKMKTATVETLEHKLTTQQRLSIAINHCLLLMYSNQADQCEQQVKKLQVQYPECSELPLILAALRAKNRQVDKAVEILQEYAARNRENSFNTSMVLVQILLQQDRVSQACSVLQALGDLSYKPGIVSALVSLYLSVENQEAASQVLKDAVEWYKKNQPKSPELVVLWRESANFHIRHGEAELAAKRLEELRKVHPEDMKALAQLITAYSQFDSKKAQSISKELPPVTELAKQVDVDALETTSWSMGAKYVKKSAKTDPSPSVHKGSSDTPNDALLLKKKKKKKKKKTKLPKNYDASSPPDPERWLPRKERSTYKRRKDKRSAGIGKGTQGAVAGGDTGLDATKMQSMSSPRPGAGGTPSPSTGGATGGGQASSQGPRQQRKQPQQRKNKKGGGKGNKW